MMTLADTWIQVLGLEAYSCLYNVITAIDQVIYYKLKTAFQENKWLSNTVWDTKMPTVLNGGKLDGNHERLLLLLKTLEWTHLGTWPIS